MCIILRLCSSIVSIGQMDEGRCQVLDNGIIICIHGYEHVSNRSGEPERATGTRWIWEEEQENCSSSLRFS
jgi:hypothetical protein